MKTLTDTLKAAGMSLTRKPITTVTVEKRRLDFGASAFKTATNPGSLGDKGSDPWDTFLFGDQLTITDDPNGAGGKSILRCYSYKLNDGGSTNRATYINRVTDGYADSGTQWDTWAKCRSSDDQQVKDYCAESLSANSSGTDIRIRYVKSGTTELWEIASDDYGVTWGAPSKIMDLPADFTVGQARVVCPNNYDIFLVATPASTPDYVEVYYSHYDLYNGSPSWSSWANWTCRSFCEFTGYIGSSFAGATYMGAMPDSYSEATGKMIFFWTDETEGRTLVSIVQHGIWSDPQTVLPYDYVDEGVGFLAHSITAMEVDGEYVAFLCGRLNRSDSAGANTQSMDCYMMSKDGINWTMGEDFFITTNDTRGHLHVQDEYIFYSGLQSIYIADATSIVGVSNSNVVATVSDDVVNWVVSHPPSGAASQARITIANGDKTYNDHSIVAVGSIVTVSGGYNTESGDETSTVFTGSIDNPEQQSSIDKNDIVVSARDLAMKSLVEPRADMTHDVRSQLLWREDFSDVTEDGAPSKFAVQQGTFNVYEATDCMKIEYLNMENQVAFATMTPTEYSIVRMKFRITGHAEPRRLAGIVFQAQDLDNYISVEYYGDDGTGRANKISLRVMKEGSEAEVATTAALDPAWVADTWYWIMVYFKYGRCCVYYRADSSTDWTEASFSPYTWDQTAAPFGEGYVGIKGDLGMAAAELTCRINYDQTQGVCLDSISEFDSSGTVRIDDEDISYTSKTGEKTAWTKEPNSTHNNYICTGAYGEYGECETSEWEEYVLGWPETCDPQCGVTRVCTKSECSAESECSGGPMIEWSGGIQDYDYENDDTFWIGEGLKTLTRGANDTVATHHNSGTTCFQVETDRIEIDIFEAVDLNRALCIEDHIEHLGTRAGILDYCFLDKLGDTFTGDDIDTDKWNTTGATGTWQISSGKLAGTNTGTWGGILSASSIARNMIINTKITVADGDGAGVAFGCSSPNALTFGGYILALMKTDSTDTIRLYNHTYPEEVETFTLLYNQPCSITIPDGEEINLRVAVRDRWISVWLGNHLVANFYGSISTYDREGYVGVVCYDAATFDDFEVPELCEFVDDVIVDPGMSWGEALRRLIQQRHIVTYGRYDGSLVAGRFDTRDDADDFEDTLVQASKQINDSGIVTRALVWGAEVWAEYMDTTFLRTRGNRYQQYDNPDLMTETECVTEAQALIKKSKEEADQRNFTGGAALHVEREDKITITNALDGTSGDYIINDISLTYGLTESEATFDMNVGTRAYIS